MEGVSDDYLKPFLRRNWDKAVRNNGLSSLLRDFFTVPDPWNITNLSINTAPVLETLASQFASLTDVVKFNFFLCFPYVKYHHILVHRPVLSTIASILFQGVPAFMERVTKEFRSLIAQSEESEKAIVTKAKHVDLICTTSELFDIMPDAYQAAIQIVREELRKMLDEISYDREQNRAVSGLLGDDDELFAFIKERPPTPPQLVPEIGSKQYGLRQTIRYGNNELPISRADAEKMERDKQKALAVRRANLEGIAKIEKIIAQEEEKYIEMAKSKGLKDFDQLPSTRSRQPTKPRRKRDYAAETLKRKARRAIKQGKTLPEVVHTSKPGGGFEMLTDKEGYPINRAPVKAQPPTLSLSHKMPVVANPVQLSGSKPMVLPTVRYVRSGHAVPVTFMIKPKTLILPQTDVTHTLVHKASARNPTYIRTIVKTSAIGQNMRIVEKITAVKKLEQGKTKVILKSPPSPHPPSTSQTEAETDSEDTITPFAGDLQKVHHGHIVEDVNKKGPVNSGVAVDDEGIPANQYNKVPALYPSVQYEAEPVRRVIKGKVFSIPPNVSIRKGSSIPTASNGTSPGKKVMTLSKGAVRTISGSGNPVVLRPFKDEKGFTVLRVVPATPAETKNNIYQSNNSSQNQIKLQSGRYQDGIRVVQPVTLVPKQPVRRPPPKIRVIAKPNQTTINTKQILVTSPKKPIPATRTTQPISANSTTNISRVKPSPIVINKKPINFLAYQGGQPFIFRPNQRNLHYERRAQYQEQSRKVYVRTVRQPNQECQRKEQQQQPYDPNSDYINQLHQEFPWQQVAHYEEVQENDESGSAQFEGDQTDKGMEVQQYAEVQTAGGMEVQQQFEDMPHFEDVQNQIARSEKNHRIEKVSNVASMQVQQYEEVPNAKGTEVKQFGEVQNDGGMGVQQYEHVRNLSARDMKVQQFEGMQSSKGMEIRQFEKVQTADGRRMHQFNEMRQFEEIRSDQGMGGQQFDQVQTDKNMTMERFNGVPATGGMKLQPFGNMRQFKEIQSPRGKGMQQFIPEHYVRNGEVSHFEKTDSGVEVQQFEKVQTTRGMGMQQQYEDMPRFENAQTVGGMKVQQFQEMRTAQAGNMDIQQRGEMHIGGGIEVQQTAHCNVIQETGQFYQNNVNMESQDFAQYTDVPTDQETVTHNTGHLEMQQAVQPYEDPEQDMNYIDNIDDIPNGNLIQYIDEGNVADDGYQQDALLQNNTFGENNLIDQALQMAMYPEEGELQMKGGQCPLPMETDDVYYKEQEAPVENVTYTKNKNGEMQATVTARDDYAFDEQEFENIKLAYDDLFREHEGSTVDEKQRKMMAAFILGRLENPSPQLSPAYTIQIYEKTQEVIVENMIAQQVVELCFEMNFETMQWSRVRRTEVFCHNGKHETTEYLAGPDGEEDITQTDTIYKFFDITGKLVNEYKSMDKRPVETQQQMEFQQPLEMQHPVYC